MMHDDVKVLMGSWNRLPELECTTGVCATDQGSHLRLQLMTEVHVCTVHPAATMVKLERIAASPEGIAKFKERPESSAAHAINCFVNVLEAMTEGMLGGLEQLTHASMVLSSPQADTLLVAPVPGAPPLPEGQPAPTAQAFVKQLQVSFLATTQV